MDCKRFKMIIEAVNESKERAKAGISSEMNYTPPRHREKELQRAKKGKVNNRIVLFPSDNDPFSSDLFPDGSV